MYIWRTCSVNLVVRNLSLSKDGTWERGKTQKTITEDDQNCRMILRMRLAMAEL